MAAFRMIHLLDKTTLRVAGTVLALAASLAFLWAARKTLLIFLFSMLFAYLLEPVVSRVQGWLGNRRAAAIALVYFGLLVLLLTVGLALGPKIVDEGRKLAQTAPELYEKVSSGSIAQQVGQQRGWSQETQIRLHDFLAGHRQQVVEFTQMAATRIGGLASNSFWIILIPILAIFFIAERGRFGEAIGRIVEHRRDRRLLRVIMSDLDEMLAHFVRAQVYLAIVSAAIYITVLGIMRVPYAFILGAIGGVLEFIPLVGPLTAAALILGISFTSNYPHLLWIAVFLAVWRGVQDYFVTPRVFGGRLEVHPLAAIFGVLVGGEIAGVAGIYLSIPIIATVRILWRRLGEYKDDMMMEKESATTHAIT